jgi:hypothetical protein
VTLNLLVASRHGIHLSGDFRLTYRDQTYIDDLSVQKVIPVSRFAWTGLISFSGLARTPGLEVDQWLGDACALFDKRGRPRDARETLAQFLERVRSLDGWLSRVYGDKRLTIVIAGFNGRKPFAVVISNHEDADGRPLNSVSPVLKQSVLKPRKVIARAFGFHDAVRHHELSTLLDLADRNEPRQLADAMAALNATAATRDVPSTISSECVVGGLDPTGKGWARPYGINESSEYMPPFVRRSMPPGSPGLLLKRGPGGEMLKPGWVQMGFSRQSRAPGRRAAMGVVYELRNVESVVTHLLPNGAYPSNFYAW